MQAADSQWLQAIDKLITGNKESASALYVRMFRGSTGHSLYKMHAALQALQFTHL